MHDFVDWYVEEAPGNVRETMEIVEAQICHGKDIQEHKNPADQSSD